MTHHLTKYLTDIIRYLEDKTCSKDIFGLASVSHILINCHVIAVHLSPPRTSADHQKKLGINDNVMLRL